MSLVKKNEYLTNLGKTFNVNTGNNTIPNAAGSFIAHKAINAYLKADGRTNVQFNETILADSKVTPEIELMDALSNFAWNWLKVQISDGYVPSQTSPTNTASLRISLARQVECLSTQGK